MPSYLNRQSKIRVLSADIQNKSSNVSQLVDILGIDAASKDTSNNAQNTRKKYEVFTSGSNSNPNGTRQVTSSLYQTVFDQDFTLQTSNELLDVTFGLHESSREVADNTTGTDASGKLLFPDQVLMMREKVNIYRQYAQYLLGDPSGYFYVPYESTTEANKINAAVFINIHRLFTRDEIKKDTFAIKLNKAANATQGDNLTSAGANPIIYSDSGALTSHRLTQHGGSVASLKTSAGVEVGLIFYERGIVVLDASKVFEYEDFVSGTSNVTSALTAGRSYKIAALGDTTIANWRNLGVLSSVTPAVGTIFVAKNPQPADVSAYGTGTVNASDNLLDGDVKVAVGISANAGLSTTTLDFTNTLRNLFVSGSIDDVLDHICSTRFDRTSTSSIAFQNRTVINSSLIFCRAAPSQANYSSNPTFTKSDGSIRVIDDPETEDPFVYITTVGLYDSNNNLLAVAKTSRPIEKNPETDLSIRIRLDF
jgi:hypothetical protein